MDWNCFLTERDQQVFAGSGYGVGAGFGQRPVVLVVDVTYNFCGDRAEPILESIKRWRNSCGEEAWEAIPHLRALIGRAHQRRVPVIYTTGMDYRPDGFDAGRWADKNRRFAETTTEADGDERQPKGNEIIPPLKPHACDIVVRKAKPSAFFGTLLVSHLTSLQADSLIVCGTTTSGCVRATVVDAFSYNYRVGIVEEATFDRGQASHHVSLFDLSRKYADVVSLPEVLDYLDGMPSDLFADQFPALESSAL